MNKLYNRIYNAVNEGIQKALLIDPEQNDVSINYTYHKINNNADIISYYVNELLNNNDNAYQNILEFHNKNIQYTYKVKNFNELSDIFNKIHNITKNIDLSWIDIANAVTFIMNDNREISICEINNKDKKNIVFIKFNNIEGFNHSIIIHKNLLIGEKIWSNENTNIKQADNNASNGYGNTRIIKNEADNGTIDLDNYPVFEYCINQLNKLDSYEGYLPAINELDFLSKNIDLINYILKYVNRKKLNIHSGLWWSSTQYSIIDAWGLYNGSPSHYGDKSNYYGQVLPLFVKIN